MASLGDVEMVRFEPPVTATGQLDAVARPPQCWPTPTRTTTPPGPKLGSLTLHPGHSSHTWLPKQRRRLNFTPTWLDTPRSLWEQHTNIQSACIRTAYSSFTNISFNNHLPLPFQCLTDSDRLLLLHFYSYITGREALLLVPQHVFLFYYFYTLQFSICMKRSEATRTSALPNPIALDQCWLNKDQRWKSEHHKFSSKAPSPWLMLTGFLLWLGATQVQIKQITEETACCS